MAYLPGNFRQRLQELIEKHDVKRDQLAALMGVHKSTLSRILGDSKEKDDESPKVSVDSIVKVAKYFNVSTDFLLGITTVPDPMNYPVEQFGLTEGAAKAMLSRSVHMGMLNRLLENPQFGQLTYTLYYATEANQTAGIMSRNNLLAHTGSLFTEVMNNTIKRKWQLMGLNRKLGAELINPHTVGNHQLEDEFRSVVAQIRRDIQKENPLSVPLTREFLAEMDKLLLEYADGKRENINPRIVAEVMTDKSMVANICTPEQRERFVTLMTEILSTYGGEGSGEEKT